jgi:hypothetical protein
MRCRMKYAYKMSSGYTLWSFVNVYPPPEGANGIPAICGHQEMVYHRNKDIAEIRLLRRTIFCRMRKSRLQGIPYETVQICTPRSVQNEYRQSMQKTISKKRCVMEFRTWQKCDTTAVSRFSAWHIPKRCLQGIPYQTVLSRTPCKCKHRIPPNF